MILTHKYKNKSINGILEMIKEKEKGFLLENEWKEIVYYNYDEEDAPHLERRINEFIKKKLNNSSQINKSIKSINKRLSREEEANLNKIPEDYKILYKDFVKHILDFQIKLRDKYLSNFVFIFKRIDLDNNGIIEEDEFYKLIYGLGYYGDESENQSIRLLNISDPYNNKQLTFSECVNLFALETIIDQDDQGKEVMISLLDKISGDKNVVSNFN